MATQLIQCRAPAKINFSLAVLGRRDDGFHEIESWVIPIDWCDRLTFEPASGLSLDVAGREAVVPPDRSNLVWKAAEVLARAVGIAPNVHIGLHKDLPVGGGLGGGSSDAAATLLALNDLWDLGWPAERLQPIAAELGSDVPLFLSPSPAVIRGRGERIEPLSAGFHAWLVLVIPQFSVSTARVYGAWSPPTQAGSTRCPWRHAPESAAVLMSELFNDLEPAAFQVEPRLGRLHARIDGFRGRPVRMTGSGTAMFTLFDDQRGAGEWADRLRGLLGSEAEVRVVRSLPSFRPPYGVEGFPG